MWNGMEDGMEWNGMEWKGMRQWDNLAILKVRRAVHHAGCRSISAPCTATLARLLLGNRGLGYHNQPLLSCCVCCCQHPSSIAPSHTAHAGFRVSPGSGRSMTCNHCTSSAKQPCCVIPRARYDVTHREYSRMDRANSTTRHHVRRVCRFKPQSMAARRQGMRLSRRRECSERCKGTVECNKMERDETEGRESIML